jgi:hypothetical protein
LLVQAKERGINLFGAERLLDQVTESVLEAAL